MTIQGTATLSGDGPPGDAVLRVTDLRKSFGSNAAVAGVSFELGHGESLGIVGESGSGKSTTARLIVGLESPDSGHIEISSLESGAHRRKVARTVQMIFQDPYHSFDPRLRIAEAIAEPLKLHLNLGREERRRRVEQLLDQVGLSHRQGDALPRDLSGGQRQRAAIARALGIRPSILVLDEAVAALDVSIQAQVMELLDEIRVDTGISYLFVSHDLGVVRYMTDRAVVMHRGVIVEEGNTETLLAEPSHPYTRLLLDSVPVRGWDLDRIVQDRRELGTLMNSAPPSL